jgi:hypothetical protein
MVPGTFFSSPKTHSYFGIFLRCGSRGRLGISLAV